MEEGQKKILAPDEVDLVRIFVVTIRFIIKNRIVFLISTLLGLSAASAYYSMKPKIYASKLIAECQSMEDSRVVDLLLELDKIREYEDWKQLSEKLSMTEAEVKKIKQFEPLSTITIEKEAKGIDDYLLTSDPSYKFGLKVKIKDNSILPKLQSGIIQYISLNNYARIRGTRFLKNRKTYLLFLRKQIKQLDSINRIVNANITGKYQSENLSRPGENTSVLATLQEKVVSVEDQIEFGLPVRIIQPFSVLKNPVEPVLTKVFFISILSFNFLGLLGIVFVSLRKTYLENVNKI